MKRILILWHIVIPVLIGTPIWLGAQNCGRADTVIIPVNRTLNYDVNISDVINNDLANPSQGVCGIELGFVHQFSENLELSLISPAGQRIQLIGPNTTDPAAFTFRAQWNINFLPCSETAVPDSGYVAKWNNGQPNNFINGGRYRGSYYPFVGCLEDFNTGPVNGTWRLTITNNPSTYAGAITHFRLLFCDPRGILCCDANAGSLAAFPDVAACPGDTALNLRLKPNYGAPLVPPDSTEYGYTYLVSKDGILLQYDSLADLSTLPAGSYQVCGLSYKRSDLDSFPQPDGVLRLDDYRRRLNGDSLLYCGRITNNCVDVRITAGDTTTLDRTICPGESIQIGNQTFTNPGDYFVTLPGSGGCDSTVYLRLAVSNAIVTNLDQEICPGDSVRVGNSVYKTAGSYADTLTTTGGCDSIVNLTLRVRNVLPTFLTAVLCQGDSYTVGNQTFDSTGVYDIRLPSATGCDSLINLTLLVLAPQARIAPPDTLRCTNPTVTLSGSASTPAGELTFLWTNLRGDTLGVDSTLQVDSSGFYILTTFQTVADSSCLSRDTVQVFAAGDTPVADAGEGFEINCANPTIVIGSDSTSVGANYTYRWQILNGNIVGDTAQRTTTVDASGDYVLIVTNTQSGCVATDTARVTANFTLPTAEVVAQDTLSCTQTSITLGLGNSTRGTAIRYTWRDSLGMVLGNDTVQNITRGGRYFLEVTDTLSGCSARDSIQISGGIGVPDINFGDTLIPCNVDTFTLQASVTPVGWNYAFFWNGPGVVGPGDALTTPINQPGEYIFTVVNLDNGCVLNEFVEVRQDTVCAPCVEVNLPDTLTCLQDTIALVAQLCEPCNNCTIQWTTPDGNIVSNPDSLTILINQPGRYTITVVNQSGDSTSIELDVPQVVDFPTADAGADQTKSCAVPVVPIGGSNTSNGAGFTFQWRSLNGASVADDRARVTQVQAPDTYILTVLNTQNSCSASDTVVVTADTLRPIANAGSAMALTCADSIVTLTGTGSSTGTNILYNWTTVGGNILNGANTLSVSIDAPGVYTLNVTDTLNGCTALDSVRVSSSEDKPQVPTFADEFLTCNNPSVTLDASGFVLDSMTARWCQLDSNNSIINCIDNPLLIANVGGTYRFELRDTVSGCSNFTLVRILENRAVLNVDAGAADTLNCVQPTLTLPGTVTPSNGDYRYRWTALNGSPLQNDTTLTPTVTLPDLYTLEVTDVATGCVGRDSVEILQNIDTPTVFAGFDTILTCALISWQFQASAVGNNLQYEWTTRTGNIVSGANTLNAIADQPGVYFLIVTNAQSQCSAQDTIEIGQNTFAPTAAIIRSDSLNINCNTNSATLDGSFSLSQTGSGLIFNWTALNGTPITSPADSIIQVNAAGVYRLTVQDTQNGCRDSVEVDVRDDRKLPEFSIVNIDSITCVRDSAVLTAQQTAGDANFTIRWIAPNGQILPDTTLRITVQTGGIYQFEITSRTNGCRDSIPITVPVDTLRPVVSIVPPDELGCQDTITQLVATVSGRGNFIYNWTTTDGAIVNGATTATATANAGGTYTLLVTNLQNGCATSLSTTVLENEASIQQAFYTVTPANCRRQGSGFIQIDSVSGGTGPFMYALGEFPFDVDDFFQDLRAGEYTLRVKDIFGCEWQTQVIVPQPEPITVDLGNDTLINFGDTLELIAIFDTSRLGSIRWTINGDTTSFANSPSVIVAPPLSSQYQVLVTADNGCTATDLINVAVTQTTSVYVPNAFSPDGDGVNDVFMIYAGDNIKQVKVFMIFDRWGNRLLHDGPFLPNDPKRGWDGTFNGKLMDSGVYVFYAEVEIIDGRTEIVKGDLTLVR